MTNYPKHVALQNLSLKDGAVLLSSLRQKTTYSTTAVKPFLKTMLDRLLKLSADFASRERSMDVEVGGSKYHLDDKTTAGAVFLIAQAAAESERAFEQALNLNEIRLSFIDKATNLFMGA